VSWLLPPLPPTFDAALRDVRARSFEARLAAAERLSEPEAGREAEALDGLIVMSRDLDARVRAAALRGLKGHDDLRVTDLLIAALDDREPLVREVAAAGLGSAPGERALQAIADALRSEHPEVRFQAIESYLDHAAEPSLEPLLPLLDDPDARVRENASLALDRFGDAAIAPLQRMLEDPVTSVVEGAALALARLGQSDVAPVLRRMLHDPERTIVALDLLAALGDRESSEPIARIAHALLRPLPLKVAAARALCRLGDARGPDVLRRVLRAWRSDGRSYAAEVIGELRLHALAGELRRLAAAPRGTDPLTLIEALAALAPASDDARAALEIMASRGDGAGQLAAERLAATRADPE
jgi:HEAT repeat protein